MDGDHRTEQRDEREAEIRRREGELDACDRSDGVRSVCERESADESNGRKQRSGSAVRASGNERDRREIHGRSERLGGSEYRGIRAQGVLLQQRRSGKRRAVQGGRRSDDAAGSNESGIRLRRLVQRTRRSGQQRKEV